MLLSQVTAAHRPRKALLGTTAAVVLLGVTACGSAESDATASGSGSAGTGLSIAYLASSSQNGYNQAVYEGVQQAAAEVGATTTILDGQFDAQTQFSQLEDAAASGKYDALIVLPNDNAGIAGAVPSAYDMDIPVVATLFPIGSDLTTLDPQVDGIVSTVATLPGEGATRQAEDVVTYCQDIDPCNVAILIGQLQYPFDNLRNDSYRAVLDKYDNITVVATTEGNYDRDTSLTAMTDVIQAHPDIDVVLSNADQQTEGAQIALESAGIDPSTIYLTGGGGTQEAVSAVRSGDWKADYLQCPVNMGAEALRQAVAAATGGTVTAAIDADTLCGIDVFADKEVLDASPDFTGQWSG